MQQVTLKRRQSSVSTRHSSAAFTPVIRWPLPPRAVPAATDLKEYVSTTTGHLDVKVRPV